MIILFLLFSLQISKQLTLPLTFITAGIFISCFSKNRNNQTKTNSAIHHNVHETVSTHSHYHPSCCKPRVLLLQGRANSCSWTESHHFLSIKSLSLAIAPYLLENKFPLLMVSIQKYSWTLCSTWLTTCSLLFTAIIVAYINGLASSSLNLFFTFISITSESFLFKL